MTEVEVTGGRLVVRVKGLHKLWALRSRVEVPLQHVVSAEVDPEAGRKVWKGFRVGTHWPGVITAGYFYRDGQWSFWDVSDAGRTVVIQLRNERLSRLVVEVGDPQQTVTRVRTAIGHGQDHRAATEPPPGAGL